MISPYKPAAEFIKLAKQIKLNATFVNISFVGSDALAKELGNEGAGVVVTQVVPFPMDANIPVVARYQAALKAMAAGAQPGFISLEGYLVGRAIVAALEKVDGEPTRAGSDAGRSQKAGAFDLGGFKLAYSATSNRGSDRGVPHRDSGRTARSRRSTASQKPGTVIALRDTTRSATSAIARARVSQTAYRGVCR